MGQVKKNQHLFDKVTFTRDEVREILCVIGWVGVDGWELNQSNMDASDKVEKMLKRRLKE